MCKLGQTPAGVHISGWFLLWPVWTEHGRIGPHLGTAVGGAPCSSYLVYIRFRHPDCLSAARLDRVRRSDWMAARAPVLVLPVTDATEDKSPLFEDGCVSSEDLGHASDQISPVTNRFTRDARPGAQRMHR